ncbi:MAG: hypothetical protein JJ966_09000 [Balneolaceae bacterium]|nr:hypothetical protein [Balneolaceae bacterium]
MDSLLIKPKNKEELAFLTQLMKKLGIQSASLSDEDLEDAGLTLLMKQVDRKETVSEQEVMNKLSA